MSDIDHPDVNPDLPDWIRDHIQQYLDSGGTEGHLWNGVPTLLLTTLGRRSGRWQLLPLIYGQDGDRLVLVASKGGHPSHPAWYLNLDAHPEVGVQVGAARFAATARTARGDERARLWAVMRGIWPQYDDYQAATDREIPVVVLERSATERDA
ncbi:MAG: nitroreductase family deazaflavin-dependent oxidoreductase [Pseudomonadales bacterium]